MTASTVAAAVLKAVGGARLALQDVKVEGTIRDLMAEIAMTQVYTNEESVPIEAVYTFPLPLDALLLELTVTLGERTLNGAVFPRGTAEARYEEAVTDGDGAVLLSQVTPGVYTMNVGNLKAGETATIRFRYALMQRWNGDEIRFKLPTAIAPRYGDPGAAGLAPHEQPKYSVAAELRYDLLLGVEGLLAGAEIDSPTHAITVDRTDGRTRVMLGRTKAGLDRDFVLTLRLAGEARASARAGRDLEGYVALASFKPEFWEHRDQAPKDLTLVVDCSGSMAGDSIAQARTALLLILDSLRPGDRFDIVAFGTHHQALFGLQRPASAENLLQARGFVRGLDANMGGTEIGAALETAYRLSAHPEGRGDMLLITDGQVWDKGEVARAQRSGQRIFTVGVGSAAAEGIVGRLAEVTGGVCETVTPREDMARRIHRHFQRMYSPEANSVTVRWPQAPLAVFPETLGRVYEGDTIHAFAWFKDMPQGTVGLVIDLPGAETVTQSAELDPAAADASDASAVGGAPETLARMAAAAKLDKLADEAAGTALALRYQLMSPWTNYLVVAERAEDEKADELPALCKVPQMLAAGWGGTGRVKRSTHHEDIDVTPYCKMQLPASRWAEQLDRPIVIGHQANSIGQDGNGEFEHLEIPEFLRRQEDSIAPDTNEAPSPAEFVSKLNGIVAVRLVGKSLFFTIDELQGALLPADIAAGLRDLVAHGADERSVVVMFLYMICQTKAGQSLDRNLRRNIIKVYKAMPPAPTLAADISDVLSKTPAWDVSASNHGGSVPGLSTDSRGTSGISSL